MFTETLLADAGIPHAPARAKVRRAARAGPPSDPFAFRVSTTRHGARVKNCSPTGSVTGTHAENSEVFPSESRAVAVTCPPGGTDVGNTGSKAVIPAEFVPTAIAPRKNLPSPYPEALHVSLQKNSRRKPEFGFD
jgi:hypothetical protein